MVQYVKNAVKDLVILPARVLECFSLPNKVRYENLAIESIVRQDAAPFRTYDLFLSFFNFYFCVHWCEYQDVWRGVERPSRGVGIGAQEYSDADQVEAWRGSSSCRSASAKYPSYLSGYCLGPQVQLTTLPQQN